MADEIYKMTKPELITLCKQLGIKGYSVLNKPDILALLEDYYGIYGDSMDTSDDAPMGTGIVTPELYQSGLATFTNCNFYVCNYA